MWDAERFRKALEYTDMLFCNRNELATALRYAGRQSPEELLDSYPSMQVIVNTLGGQGARIFGRNEVLDVPAAKVEVVDPTGAGDAFRAGFYAGLYRGKSWMECGTLGCAAASFAGSAPGSLTSIPDWGMVEERARSLLR